MKFASEIRHRNMCSRTEIFQRFIVPHGTIQIRFCSRIMKQERVLSCLEEYTIKLLKIGFTLGDALDANVSYNKQKKVFF